MLGKLTIDQRVKLRKVLISAFPEYDDLEIMVSDTFGESLGLIVGGRTKYENVVFGLIAWSESHGKLENLLNGATKRNSDNPDLQKFVQSLVSSSFTNAMSSPQTKEDIAQRILDLINLERSQADAPVLELNPELMVAAQAHTEMMLHYNQLNHQFSGEPSIGERFSMAGYDWSSIAENIAQGQKTPEKVISAWMSSAGHRVNLLNPKFQHLGVGCADSFWTLSLGSVAK